MVVERWWVGGSEGAGRWTERGITSCTFPGKGNARQARTEYFAADHF